MSTRTILIGLLAVAAGAAAAVGARQMAQQWDAEAEESVSVVTVAMEVPRGEMLTRDQLTTEDWPNDRVPTEALTNVDEAIGRVALGPLFRGQPVYDNLLASRDTPAGLASLVPDGMRAFTIHTPTIASGVAGFVLPGNYVDVLLTVTNRYAVGEQAAGGLTLTLLQRVEILAVDQNLDAPARNRVDATTKSLKSVTLLVTPEQAGKLSLAQNKGVLELTLRNPGDTAPVTSTPITVADLQFLGELPPEEPKETEEELVERLLADRLAQREAERQKTQAEWEEATKAELRLALEEDLRREMAESWAELARQQVAVKPATIVKVPTVLTIRTLRGTHSGQIVVKPGTSSIASKVARQSND